MKDLTYYIFISVNLKINIKVMIIFKNFNLLNQIESQCITLMLELISKHKNSFICFLKLITY
jgi:hypothetical protein